MLHKGVITETGFNVYASEETQNDRVGLVFLFPFKIFFVGKATLGDDTVQFPLCSGYFP